MLEAHLAGTSACAEQFDGGLKAKVTFKVGPDSAAVRAVMPQTEATGESLSLMECTGHGVVSLRPRCRRVTIIGLNGDTLQVGRAVAAAGRKPDRNVTFAGVRGMAGDWSVHHGRRTRAGGALSRGGPLIHLEVSPRCRWSCDPDAFDIALMTSSHPSTPMWRTAVGQGSGEGVLAALGSTGVGSIKPAERWEAQRCSQPVNSKVVSVNLARSGPITRPGAALLHRAGVLRTPSGPGSGGHGRQDDGRDGRSHALRRTEGHDDARAETAWCTTVPRHRATVVNLGSVGGQMRVEASRLLARTADIQASIVSVASSGGRSGGGGGGLFGRCNAAAGRDDRAGHVHRS